MYTRQFWLTDESEAPALTSGGTLAYMTYYNNEVYARYEDSHPEFWNRIRKQRILEALEPEAGDRILEVGCNTGWLVRELMNYSENVVGIDVNSVAIKIANMRNLLCMDVADMGFSDNFFDKIVCLHTLEHVREIDKAFEEMSRVLKPSGVVLLIYPFEIIRGMCAIGGALAMCSSILKARELHIHKLYPRKINELAVENGLCPKKSMLFMDPWPAYLTILEKPVTTDTCLHTSLRFSQAAELLSMRK